MSDRADEVVKILINRVFSGYVSASTGTALLVAIKDLPEFKEQEWIKCSDKMPECNVPIYFITRETVVAGVFTSSKIFASKTSYYQSGNTTHWMPRFLPNLPIQQESETIKALREFLEKYSKAMTATSEAYDEGFNQAIKIVQNIEKGNL